MFLRITATTQELHALRLGSSPKTAWPAFRAEQNNGR